MEVLSARGLAPDEFLAGFHVEDADGTFAVDGLALAGVEGLVFLVVVGGVVDWGLGYGGVGEDGLGGVSWE